MLFFISLIMVFVSSYMAGCIAAPKNKDNKLYGPAPFLYILLTMFAQVVLTFEVLSLFKAINEVNVLLINVVFLITSVLMWLKKGKPVYQPEIKQKVSEIWKALKRDKILMIMAFGFCFLMMTVVVLDAFLPVTGGDALTYHLNRSSYWLHQSSLNHFVISDDRNLVMPINSEILYLWNLLFLRNDVGLYFISFVGYIASIFCVYNILEYFKFTRRRILWSIFILTSFASVIVELSSLETDVLIAGLVLSSVTLFLYALKERKTGMLFYSSLAYALAMGTKSPAVIAFPAAFMLMTYFSYRETKKEFYKPLMAYMLFLIVNFMIFSSYNYVLNFIDFGNPLGSESARAVHGFRGGIKAFIANYIKYIFMMFDFSGFKYSEYVGNYIIQARESLLTFLNIPLDLGVEMSDNNEVNNRLINVKTGAGILGFLVFLPSLLTSLVLGVVRKHNNKLKILCAFGVMFLINLACLSFSIAYMVFSVRFLTFLIVISSPVLAISYIKKTNIVKLLILFFVLSYFFIISTNLSGRGFVDISNTILSTPTINHARERIRCALYVGFDGKNAYCYVKDYIQKLPQGSKIALFPDATDSIYIVNMLNSHGYNIETLLPENAPNYSYDKYDYIITSRKVLTSTVLLKTTKDITTEYKIAPNGSAYYPEYRPFSCVYEKHGGGFFTTEQYKDGAIVMDSRCYIDHNFFEPKGFKIKQIYDFKSENIRYQGYVTIYEKIKPEN